MLAYWTAAVLFFSIAGFLIHKFLASGKSSAKIFVIVFFSALILTTINSIILGNSGTQSVIKYLSYSFLPFTSVTAIYFLYFSPSIHKHKLLFGTIFVGSIVGASLTAKFSKLQEGNLQANQIAAKDNEYERLIEEDSREQENKIRTAEHFGEKVIIFEGKIEIGDYQNLKKRVMESGPEYRKLVLMSPGGNVVESIKMGRLLRLFKLSAIVPVKYFKDNIRDCDPSPKDPENCICASACFYVLVGATERQASEVGIHRASFDPYASRKMSGIDAVATNAKIRKLVEDYFDEMGVNRDVIVRMNSIPPDQVEYLKSELLDKYINGDLPEHHDWILTKCSQLSDSTVKRHCERSARQQLTNEVWQKLLSNEKLQPDEKR
jgi:hypothetical protein